MARCVRRTLPRVLVTAAVVGLLVTSGCTDTTRPKARDLSSLGPITPTPPGSPATSTGPVLPDPNFERPHTAVGEILLAAFPEPESLGPGWDYPDLDQESAEVPVALERDVNDVVDGSVPQDCLRLNPMPLPLAAAEVHYTFQGTAVNAFAVGFDDAGVSRAFLSLLVSNLEDCKPETGDAGEDLVGQVITLVDGVVLSERFPGEEQDRRADLAILADRAVVLLEAPVGLGEEPFTSSRSLELAEAFRASLG